MFQTYRTATLVRLHVVDAAASPPRSCSGEAETSGRRREKDRQRDPRAILHWEKRMMSRPPLCTGSASRRTTEVTDFKTRAGAEETSRDGRATIDHESVGHELKECTCSRGRHSC